MRACLLSCFVVSSCLLRLSFFFFFNDTATTEIYTLSLHDALPICPAEPVLRRVLAAAGAPTQVGDVVLLRHLARRAIGLPVQGQPAVAGGSGQGGAAVAANPLDRQPLQGRPPVGGVRLLTRGDEGPD